MHLSNKRRSQKKRKTEQSGTDDILQAVTLQLFIDRIANLRSKTKIDVTDCLLIASVCNYYQQFYSQISQLSFSFGQITLEQGVLPDNSGWKAISKTVAYEVSRVLGWRFMYVGEVMTQSLKQLKMIDMSAFIRPPKPKSPLSSTDALRINAFQIKVDAK